MNNLELQLADHVAVKNDSLIAGDFSVILVGFVGYDDGSVENILLDGIAGGPGAALTSEEITHVVNRAALQLNFLAPLRAFCSDLATYNAVPTNIAANFLVGGLTHIRCPYHTVTTLYKAIVKNANISIGGVRLDFGNLRQHLANHPLLAGSFRILSLCTLAGAEQVYTRFRFLIQNDFFTRLELIARNTQGISQGGYLAISFWLRLAEVHRLLTRPMNAVNIASWTQLLGFYRNHIGIQSVALISETIQQFVDLHAIVAVPFRPDFLSTKIPYQVKGIFLFHCYRLPSLRELITFGDILGARGYFGPAVGGFGSTFLRLEPLPAEEQKKLSRG